METKMRICNPGSVATCGWFTALLLAALLAGCGGGGSNNNSTPATVAPGAAGTTLGSASPGDGATNVAIGLNGTGGVTGTELTATFTEAMNPLTLKAAGTFTLKAANGTSVPVSSPWMPQTRLRPSQQ
jgi:hypothetical protein